MLPDVLWRCSIIELTSMPVSVEIIVTSLLLGLAGSLHCVGMCGPLLLALPLDAAGRTHVLRRMGVYHSGRILMYALLGLLFGLLGKGLAIAGLQKVLAIGAGVFLIGMAFMAWRFEQLVTVLPGFGSATRWVKTRMGGLLRQPGGGGTFALGLFNGLLPCGMVYAALAGALSTTEPAGGALFMAIFGLGTLPLLLMVSVLGQRLSSSLRQRVRLLQPILLTVAALLLLQRGLHLDLSLFDSAVPKAGADCH